MQLARERHKLFAAFPFRIGFPPLAFPLLSPHAVTRAFELGDRHSLIEL
jgi:hypothetical protein